jgi:hypothetical protein
MLKKTQEKFVLLGAILVIVAITLPYITPSPNPLPLFKVASTDLHAQKLQLCVLFGQSNWYFDSGESSWYNPPGMGSWPSWTDPLGSAIQNAMCNNWPHYCP